MSDRRGVRGLRSLAATVVLGIGVLGAAVPAHAEYDYVAPGYTQWLWAGEGSVNGEDARVTHTVVREDGWLIAEVMILDESAEENEAVLFEVPPWGSSLADGRQLGTEVLEPGSRLAVSGDSLWVLTDHPARDPDGRLMQLVELDASTGERRRVLDGTWWFPALELDPMTGELWVFDYRCERDCTEENPGRSRHSLVRLDPETGETTEVLPDPQEGRRSPYQRCQPDDTEADAGRVVVEGGRCEEALWLAVSPDGSRFAASSPGNKVVEIFDRDGAFLHAVRDNGVRIRDLAWGSPGACFEDLLVYADSQGLTAVPDASPTASQHRLAAGGMQTSHVAAASPEELVVVHRPVASLEKTDGVVVACEGAARPAAPGSSPEEGTAAGDEPEEGPARAAGGDTGALGAGAPAGAPSGGAQEAAPAEQPQTADRQPGAMADAPTERPDSRLSASEQGAAISGWAPFAAGTLLLVIGVVGAIVLRRPEDPR